MGEAVFASLNGSCGAYAAVLAGRGMSPCFLHPANANVACNLARPVTSERALF